MPTQTQHTNDEVQEGARLCLSAYNFFEVTDGEQNPLAGIAALEALFAARLSKDPVYTEEQRKYIADFQFAKNVIGLVDADVTAANTKAAMQAVFTSLSPGLSLNYLSQIHYVR